MIAARQLLTNPSEYRQPGVWNVEQLNPDPFMADLNAYGLPWVETDPSRPVSLPLGAAKSVVRSDGAELRVDLGQGRWVRVRGTSSVADLTKYAGRLRPPP